jgi:hypothetical protein
MPGCCSSPRSRLPDLGSCDFLYHFSGILHRANFRTGVSVEIWTATPTSRIIILLTVGCIGNVREAHSRALRMSSGRVCGLPKTFYNLLIK